MKFADLADMNLHWKASPEEFARNDKHLSRAAQGDLHIRPNTFPVSVGNIYAILGPRQVGKTTYLKQLIHRAIVEERHAPRQILYLSADACHSPEEFRRSIQQFLQMTAPGSTGILFLDEITRLDRWPTELKRLADQGITDRFPIVCTGSSAHELRRQSEQLPGRGLEGNTHILRPLAFRRFVQLVSPHYRRLSDDEGFARTLAEMERLLEHARASSMAEIVGAVKVIAPFQRELDLLLRHYLQVGGYPRAVKGAMERRDGYDPRALLRGAEAPRVPMDFAEVLIRDALGDAVRQDRNEGIARNLLRVLVQKEGQRGSYNMLAKEVGVNHTTVIDYVSVLEGSYLLLALEAHDPRTGEPKPKSDKKFHLTDPYLRIALESHLRGIVPSEIARLIGEDEERLGHVVESTVVHHLAQHGEVPYQRDRWSFLGFAYDARKRELDAVVSEAKERSGVEVKYQADVRRGAATTFDGLDRTIVVSRDDLDLEVEQQPVVPASLFLSVLEPSVRHL